MAATRRARITGRLTYANVMSTLAVVLVLAGGTAVAASVAPNSVGSRAIKDNAVQSADLRDGAAVGSSDVIDGSIGEADLGSGSVSSGKVADGTIGEADLGSGSVTSSELGTITRVERTLTIPAGQVQTVVATCPAGSIALSGGQRGDAGVYTIALSKENVTEAWVYQAQNTTASNKLGTAFVYCLAV